MEDMGQLTLFDSYILQNIFFFFQLSMDNLGKKWKWGKKKKNYACVCLCQRICRAIEKNMTSSSLL